MGLAELEAEIKKKGEAEIAKISKETEARIKEIQTEIDAEVGKEKKRILLMGEREAAATERRILASAKLTAKSMVGREKVAILDNVFEETRKRVLKLPAAEKQHMLETFIKHGRKEIADPVIYVESEYKDMISGAHVKHLGDFGVLLESRDGATAIDSTLSAHLENIRLGVISDLVKILFADKK